MPNTNVLFHIKGGRYLAKDSGITFDISRRFKSGLRIGGFLICYLPTVNQVQKLVEYLDVWQEIEIVETIQRSWQSKQNALRPQSNMIGHTGFIVSARWND